MTALPSGWAHAALGQLCDSGQYGWTTRAKSQGSVRFLRTTDITGSQIDWRSVPFCEEIPPNTDKYLLAANDIVISRAGSVGFSKLISEVPEPTVFASYLIRFKPSSAVEPRYIAAYLRSAQYWRDIGVASAGIALANVNATKLAALQVPVAPLAEQRRIADKLDTVLARVDACRKSLAGVPPLLKRFRQAVLVAAMSGRLTEDWRQTHAIHASPRTLTLQELCSPGRVITYGVIKLGAEVEAGVPCLRTSNVRWLRLELDGLKRIASALSAEYGRTILRGGEVLVNVRGTLGGVAVVDMSMAGWNVSREVAVLPINTSLANSKFISLYLASDESQKWLSGVEKGVAYVGINIEDLRNLPVRLPEQGEQIEVVRRVETLFAFADRLEARLSQAQTSVDRLTPALLAKAFRGELVPQDPADEAAGALMQLRAAQLAEAPSRRGRPRRAASTA